MYVSISYPLALMAQPVRESQYSLEFQAFTFENFENPYFHSQPIVLLGAPTRARNPSKSPCLAVHLQGTWSRADLVIEKRRWDQINIARGTTDSEIESVIRIRFADKMAPLVLIPNLAICILLQIGTTGIGSKSYLPGCINAQPHGLGLPYQHYQLVSVGIFISQGPIS